MQRRTYNERVREAKNIHPEVAEVLEKYPDVYQGAFEGEGYRVRVDIETYKSEDRSFVALLSQDAFTDSKGKSHRFVLTIFEPDHALREFEFWRTFVECGEVRDYENPESHELKREYNLIDIDHTGDYVRIKVVSEEGEAGITYEGVGNDWKVIEGE